VKGPGKRAGYCQFAAISSDDGFAHIDVAACMGCGVCGIQGSQGAISLVRDPANGEPLEIQKLIEHAAQ
jgi:Fe-S-cluster-containing hydrogenase component 2